MNIHVRFRFALVIALAALAAPTCAEVPGGVACLVILPVESANRSPISDVVATLIDRGVRYPPTYSTGRAIIDMTGVCSGSAEIELSHPRYQTTTVRYTSPRDRGFSGNTFTDTLTVVMTAR